MHYRMNPREVFGIFLSMFVCSSIIRRPPPESAVVPWICFVIRHVLGSRLVGHFRQFLRFASDLCAISSEHMDTERVLSDFYPTGGQQPVDMLKVIAAADNRCLQ